MSYKPNLQVLLIVVQQLLWALAPQYFHLVLRLATVLPVDKSDECPAACLALDLVLLDDARDALDLGFPTACRELVLQGCAVDFRFPAAACLLAACLYRRRVEGR